MSTSHAHARTAARAVIDSTRDALLRAQVTQLFRHVNLGFIATSVNALVLVGVLRHTVERNDLALWFAAIALVTITRAVQAGIFWRHVERSDFDPIRWFWYFSAGIGASGVIWGSSGILLFPPSQAHQTFIAFVLGGMVAGASATFSIRLTTFFLFTVPALSPIIVQFLLEGGELDIAMGVMIFLFGVLLSGVAYRINQFWQVILDVRQDSLIAGTLFPPLRETKVETDGVPSADPTEAVYDVSTHRLGELTEVLGNLQDRAEQRVRSRLRNNVLHAKIDALSTFAKGTAHLFGKMASQIGESVEAIRGKRASSTEEATELVGQVAHLLEQLQAAVRTLKEYSSGTSGVFRAIDINAVVESAVEDWKDSNRHARVDFRLGEDLPELVTDEQEFRSAVFALIANARESSGSRGRIRVGTGVCNAWDIDVNRTVMELEAPAESYLYVDVEDDGLGLTEGLAERMFDPFYTTKERGRGMGLAVVFAFVRRHRGTAIARDSDLGGASIRLFFPLASETPLLLAMSAESREENEALSE